MEDLLVCIYMAKTRNGFRAQMSHNPLVDALVLAEDDPEGALDLLTPFLPIGIADYVLKAVFTPPEIKGCAKPGEVHGSFLNRFLPIASYDTLVLRKAGLVSGLVRQICRIIGSGQFWVAGDKYPRKIYYRNLSTLKTDENEINQLPAVRKALRGRILFLEELEKSLKENCQDMGFGENGFVPANLLDNLHVLALRGEIDIMPSLGFTAPGEVTCFRCGHKIKLKGILTWQAAARDNVYRSQCPICRFPSLYCERCNTMGESRLCRGLFAMEESRTPRLGAGYKVDIRGVPPLTPAQSHASGDLANFVKNGQLPECLLWAVCGAGKTEVVLAAITAALESGGRVLYAVPRRDVIKELSPRLQSWFYGFDMVTGFGGSPENFRSSPLVLATTHQVLRYYSQFDLVVLDEADAYPYQGSEMLRRAVKRAAKRGGRTVYLTATPDNKMVKGVSRGLIKLITIPARYHGQPVPEPQIIKAIPFQKEKDGSWAAAPLVIELLSKWLIRTTCQVFLFLPTVHAVETFGPVLEKTCNPISPGVLRYSHARDPLRDQKRDDFKAGKFRVFVTTTIMERGVTVREANVLVLDADHQPVFDDGTLIQMAGRAGRSAEFPDGQVVFIGRSVSSAMEQARDKIKFLNNTAKREGYLKKAGVDKHDDF